MEEEESDQVTGNWELEGDEIPCVMEVCISHVNDRLYWVHTQKEWTGVHPVGAKEARQCLAAYITVNSVKAFCLWEYPRSNEPGLCLGNKGVNLSTG